MLASILPHRHLVSDTDEVVGKSFDDCRRLSLLDGCFIDRNKDSLRRLYDHSAVRLITDTSRNQYPPQSSRQTAKVTYLLLAVDTALVGL